MEVGPLVTSQILMNLLTLYVVPSKIKMYHIHYTVLINYPLPLFKFVLSFKILYCLLEMDIIIIYVAWDILLNVYLKMYYTYSSFCGVKS